MKASIINDKTKRAGVIGDPIKHSLSPKIHTYLLKKYDIDGIYLSYRVVADDLENTAREFAQSGLKGFNVTLPHKEEIFKICDFTSKTATIVGAVNTVIVTPDKRLFGHNSDGEGFINNIKQNTTDFKFKDKNIVILGAGGATRAIYYALLKEGVKRITLCNRSDIKAQALINDFKGSFKTISLELSSWSSRSDILANCDLLVNCTSLGMLGKDDLEINLGNLNKSAIVTDIVYNPLQTSLLKNAQKQGNKTVTGIGMLVNQALVGFESWFGVKPEIDDGLMDLLQESFK
jgi:shikimate dehydrogenase